MIALLLCKPNIVKFWRLTEVLANAAKQTGRPQIITIIILVHHINLPRFYPECCGESRQVNIIQNTLNNWEQVFLAHKYKFLYTLQKSLTVPMLWRTTYELWWQHSKCGEAAIKYQAKCHLRGEAMTLVKELKSLASETETKLTISIKLEMVSLPTFHTITVY